MANFNTATRVSFALDRALKSGYDEPLNGDDAYLKRNQIVGERYVTNGQKSAKDDDRNLDNMSISQFIPKNGYHPVRLVNRGLNRIERSLQTARPDMPESVIKKRPRFTIDTKLEMETERVFQMIRPKQTLLQSEKVLYNELHAAAGL